MNKAVGESLRNARKAAGKTLQEVANALSCSVQSISQYERGVRPLKVETLFQISEAYGIPVSNLFIEIARNVYSHKEE